MADDQQLNDAADERQNEPRRGLEGKGFDAGQGRAPNVARDTDGRGSENRAGDRPVDPNVEAVTQAFEGAGRDDAPASGTSRDGPDAIDLEDMSGASRREPGR